MKYINTVIAAIIVFIFLNNYSFAQTNDTTWRVLPIKSQEEFESGAFGGEGEQHPHSIARCLNHPEYIYLSQDVGGSWRSTDNGDTWNKNLDIGLNLQFGQSIQVDPNNPDIVFIIVDPSYNYKVSGFNGLYRSENGGKSWTHVLGTNTKIERINRFNISYELSSVNSGEKVQTWYAAFMNNGLYRSDDGGLTWSDSPESSLEDHDIIYEVKTHPTDADIVYVASILGLFKSSEKGENLTRVTALPENISSICINPRNPDSIFVTVQTEGVYLSIDGGISYEKLLDHPSIRLQMNHGFPEQLYLTGNNRNSRFSSDGGETWNDIPPATTFPGLGRENGWRRWIDGNLSGIVPNPKDKNEAVAYSRSTLFKTTNGGNSFYENSTGWTGNAWSWTDNSAAFDRINPGKFAFFCNDIGTRITTSGGDWFYPNTNAQSWGWYTQKKIKWSGTYSGDFFPEDSSKIMVASVGGYFRTQLMRTEDLGKNWELVSEGAGNEEMNLFIAFNHERPNIVYAGSKFSTDTGKTFQKFAFPEIYDSPYVIGMCNAYPDIIYALNKSCTIIMRSCDAGENWETYAEPGWNFRPFDGLPTFAVDPVNPKKIYTLDANHDLASFDGETWTSFNVLDKIENRDLFNFVRNVAIDPNNPAIIHAGMFASGGSIIFRTTDAGNSWEDISYNLSRMGGALKVNPHTGELYRGGLFGTWIFPAPYDEVPTPDESLLTGIDVVPGIDVLEAGDIAALSVYDLTGCIDIADITWESNNEEIASVSPDGSVQGLKEGDCEIRATTSDGKYSDVCLLSVEAPGSVNESGKDEIEIYPNPVTDYIEIKNLTPPSPVERDYELNIFDVLGRSIEVEFQKELATLSRGGLGCVINVSHLQPGVYFVRVGDEFLKFVKI